MSALRRIKKVKGGYEVTVSCSNKPTLTAFYRTYEQCGKFADDYFLDYLGVQLKCAHHPVGDGVEPEGLNPDSLETVEIEIPMNERLKELAEQVGATIHKAMHGEAISFLENDLERFAELVLQNYASQIMTTEEREQFIRDDEREACAKLLETQIDFKGLDSQPQFLKFALDLITGCANLIRARGGK